MIGYVTDLIEGSGRWVPQRSEWRWDHIMIDWTAIPTSTMIEPHSTGFIRNDRDQLSRRWFLTENSPDSLHQRCRTSIHISHEHKPSARVWPRHRFQQGKSGLIIERQVDVDNLQAVGRSDGQRTFARIMRTWSPGNLIRLVSSLEMNRHQTLMRIRVDRSCVSLAKTWFPWICLHMYRSVWTVQRFDHLAQHRYQISGNFLQTDEALRSGVIAQQLMQCRNDVVETFLFVGRIFLDGITSKNWTIVVGMVELVNNVQHIPTDHKKSWALRLYCSHRVTLLWCLWFSSSSLGTKLHNQKKERWQWQALYLLPLMIHHAVR